MNNHNETIYTVSLGPLAFTEPEARRSGHLIPEEERITERLSHRRHDWYEFENSWRPRYQGVPQPGRCEQNSPLSRIDLDCLRRNDQIVIETAYSFYNFTVIDPTIPSGRLIGGVLGNRTVDAELISVEADGSSLGPRSLKAGSRFKFLVDLADNFCELTTSRVSSLLHRTQGRLTVSSEDRITDLLHVSGDGE